VCPGGPVHQTAVVRYRLAVHGGDRLTFVVIGEALIDLTAPVADGSAIARPGGSPLNVAVGLARLGQRTAFAGRLSGDPFGAVLRRHLERSAVDLRYVVPAAEPSTIALVELAGGQATYEFSLGADFHWSPDELEFLPGGASAVHFGSLASWLPPGDAAIASAISRLRRRGPVLISYDPNARPSLQPDAAVARRQVEESVSLAHVVKASSADVQWLYGQAADVGSVAGQWLDLGARLVVITTGADGATGWVAGQAPVSEPAFPATVADTVGAGDAFTSGLLDALARRDLLEPGRLTALNDAVRLADVIGDASRVAGITCTRPGANPPGRAEVDNWSAG
jgi:fructokinase